MNAATHTRAGNRLRLPAMLCAMAVIGFGLAALVGWVAGVPVLTTFGIELIPMAPSTALFFLLSGLAAPYLIRRSGTGRAELPVVVATAVTFTLLALLLFVLSSLGIHPAVERLGLRITDTVGGTPVGHMSPLTATGFLLAGISFLTGVWGGPGRRRPAAAAFGFASLLSLLAGVLLLAYLLGAPLLYGSSVIPPALTTSLAFLFLGISLQLAVRERVSQPNGGGEVTDNRALYAFGLIFIFLGTGVVTGGHIYSRNYERGYLSVVEEQLAAVAVLKSDSVAAWLHIQRDQAEELAANQGFSSRMQQWLDHRDEGERDLLLSVLALRKSIGDYAGVTLLDAGGEVLFSDGEQVNITDLPFDLLAGTQAGREVLHSDFYRDGAGNIRLTWAIPISTREATGERLLAIVLFTVDPGRFLFPFIQSWPTPSRSSETLLVRREGDHVLFLNELRFLDDAALSLRIPLTDERVPAVQAVLGREGIMEGIDYRGEPVVAAIHAVPESPWFMVARIDKAEILAPLRERLWLMTFLLVGIIMGAAAAVLAVWLRLHHAHRLALLTVAGEKERQYSAELERRVAERTASLEAALRELDSFAYAVAHDLKAPLRGIDGYSRLLVDDHEAQLDADGRAMLAKVREGTLQMECLIEDLLAYSRAERRPMQNEQIDIPRLARGVASERVEEMEQRGVALNIDLPEVCVAHADRDGLAMILRNLIDNALKFTSSAGEPAVTIGGACEGGGCRLWVRDNGIGFDMKYHDRIFEIFQRLQRVEEYPGTGIGLAIVRKAMERMGGRVWAESAPGEGATFYLELPR